MSFPNQINAATTLNMNTGFPGVIIVGSSLYLVVFDSVAVVLKMYKSVDAGATWAVVGGSGPADRFGVYPYSAAFDGTNIWVVNVANATTKYQVTKFDTGSDTWSAATATGVVPGANVGGTFAPIYAQWCQDDRLVVGGSNTSTNHFQSAFFQFDTALLSLISDWTAIGNSTPTTQDCEIVGLMPGTGNGTTFLIWVYDHTGVIQTKSINQQCVLSHNTIGLLELIDSFTDASLQDKNPVSYANGTRAVIIWEPSLADRTLTQVYEAFVFDPFNGWTFGAPQIIHFAGTVLGVGCCTIPTNGFQIFGVVGSEVYTATDSGGGFDLLEDLGAAQFTQEFFGVETVSGSALIFGQSYVVPG